MDAELAMEGCWDGNEPVVHRLCCIIFMRLNSIKSKVVEITCLVIFSSYEIWFSFDRKWAEVQNTKRTPTKCEHTNYVWFSRLTKLAC